MAITSNSSEVITATDVSGNTIINRLTPLTFVASALPEFYGQLVGTSPIALALPVNPAQQFMIRHTGTMGTVTATITGQGWNATVILQVGGKWELFQTTVGAGITAVTVQASVANVPVEVYAAG